MQAVKQGAQASNGHAAVPAPQPSIVRGDEPPPSAAYSPTNTGLTGSELQKLRKEINCVWHEATDIQREKGYINITNVGDWLVRAEKSLSDAPYPATQAMYCLLRARQSLAKAQEAATCEIWGYCVITVELLYLLTIIIGRLWLHGHVEGILELRFHTVPLYVFIWEFLGGVAWCMYCAAYWAKRRLFDKHYILWYLAHPWLSAVLGGAVSLVILGGLASIGGAENGSPSPSEARMALLAIVSFFAGFNTHKVWKLLDRSAAKLLGQEEKNDLEAVHGLLLEDRRQAPAALIERPPVGQ